MRYLLGDYIELKIDWNVAPHFSLLGWRNCRRPTGSFKDECINLARNLYDLVNEPLTIHMSGGIDSEVIALSCLEAKIPFSAAIFCYDEGNTHDTKWAVEFCEAHKVPMAQIAFAADNFLQTEALEICRQYRCPHPAIAFEIARLQQTSGFAVMGNGDPDLFMQPTTHESYFVDYYDGYVPWLWQIANGAKACTNFFRHTPEIFYSFLCDPLLIMWEQKAPHLNMYTLGWWKYYIYKSHWPMLKKRRKWTGYELFGGNYAATKQKLITEMQSQELYTTFSLTDLRNYLRPIT